MLFEDQVTLVIPVFNEAESLPGLLEEIRTVISRSLAVVVVDDASEDASVAIVWNMKSSDPYLSLVRHRHRCGQSAAVYSGVRFARTLWIATLDGDGQNVPGDLRRLLEQLAENPDTVMVIGLRSHRCDSWDRRLGSSIANRIRQFVLKDSCNDSGCGLKLFRRDCFLELPYFVSMHRFLPALFRARGYPVRQVAVSHRRRRYGYSKYRNLSRVLAGLVDLIGVWWLLRRTHLPENIVD